MITQLPQQWSHQLASIAHIKSVFSEIFFDVPRSMNLFYSFIILMIGDIAIRNSGIDKQMVKLPKWLRFAIYLFVISWFIMYGTFSTPQEFIYFQF